MMNTSTTTGTYDVTFSWKPEGRGRKFKRDAHALARRLRIPFVRQVLYEYQHEESPGFRTAQSYGHPWTSTNALTNFSFACTCHKRERYSRKGRKGKR